VLPAARLAPAMPPPSPRGAGMDVDGGDVDVVYVSRYWWHRYRTFSSPGPICNADMLCDHGCVKRRLEGAAGRLAVALTVAEYSALARAYGAAEPPLRSLEPCRACVHEAALLAQRRERERSEVLRIDSRTLPRKREAGAAADADPTAKWYIVSEVWLRQWRAFIECTGRDDGTARGVLPPGPIDNARLLNRAGPLPNLRPLIHYRGVNHATWSFLVSVYGGGPALPRDNIVL